jgi:fumarate hydratase subunit alpha
VKEIEASKITERIAEMAQEANFCLSDDVVQALKQAGVKEESPLGKQAIEQLMENIRLAKAERMPLCQDTGTTVVFLELGQDTHVRGGDLYTAVEEGVRRGYSEGFLRKSIVRQPYSARINTKDNTPPIIHTEIVPGNNLRIVVMPKGGGSENMSRLFMLKPAQGRTAVIESVLKSVEEAGSNPCPPVIVGVGIGGTAEKAMTMAKHSLLRPVGEPSKDAENAGLEKELLQKVNDLGIGPEGFGGRITALAVHVETFPTHIASLPVAVNIQCNAARWKEVTL